MKPILSPFKPKLSEGDKHNRTLLLVDYSNLVYRSYFSTSSLWDDRPYLPVIRFLDSLRLCVQKTKTPGVPMEIIFAGESKTPLDRTKLDPEYKSNRSTPSNDILKKFRKTLVRIIRGMGCEILTRDGAEADDIIAAIVKDTCKECSGSCKCGGACKHPNDKYDTDVYVLTNDKDLNQLLKFKRCYIYLSHGFFYTKEDFINEYGFDPKYFDIYKAMIGDKSDNVSGTPGYGPVKAKNAILSGILPSDEEFERALELIKLNYDQDIPNVGNTIEIDPGLFYKLPSFIKTTYGGQYSHAVDEIILALQKLDLVYNGKR